MGLDVVAGVEVVQAELLGAARGPQAQGIDGVVLVAGDWKIVRHSEDVVGVHPLHAEAAVLVHGFMGAAVEADADRVFRPFDRPGGAQSQPFIRDLDLLAVDDLLVEDAVVVHDAVAAGGNAQSGHGVQKAGGQTAEAAVAKPGIVLFPDEVVQLKAVSLKHPARLRLQPEIEDARAQQLADEKLHR